jgi:hypothetical protein
MAFLANSHRFPIRDDLSVFSIRQTFGNGVDLIFILQRKAIHWLYFDEKLGCNSVDCKRCLAVVYALVCRSTRALFVVMTPDYLWLIVYVILSL